MATIQLQLARSLPPSRLRSSSDPFVDPAAAKKKQRPPPPPPKSKPSARMPAAVPKSAPPHRDNHEITEAVRDTVTYRTQTDNSPRTRMGRSQTAISPAQNTTSRPAGRRSQSQDSGGIVEKPRSSGKSRGSKKGSQHADVIDRLDFTGVGPMFHHDGPFDACAPSRNKHRNQAPMYAWTGKPEHAPRGDSAYPPTLAYQAFSNDYPDPPKKKVDAIAEAWGIHEPEPFEEFFAGGGSTRPDGDTPASSIYNGKESHGSLSHSSPATRRPKEDKDARPRIAARRSLVPPPQPIFVPDQSDTADVPPASPPLGSPGYPNRSKSLMHRIRKMRDAPNVPVSADYQQPPSPSARAISYQSDSDGTRPTHRSQNSFLGRFGGGTRTNPASVPEKPEPFIFIDAQNQNQTNKELPATPMNGGTTPPGEKGAYFDGGPLGRKTSIMKKVGKVVRGAK